MRSNEIENLKKNLKLTKKQRDILIGLLLGDGHLETQNKGRTYRLKIEHSISQKDYVFWLQEVFNEWIRAPARVRNKHAPKKGNVASIGFATYSHGAFRFYAHQFYDAEGKKKIPKMIKKFLTPRVVAIWFMDDGSWKSKNHRTYIIHTDGFEKKDLERLKSALRELFGIESSLHKQYKNWRLYVKTDSADNFRKMVQPYIIPSMKYKLGNTMPKE